MNHAFTDAATHAANAALHESSAPPPASVLDACMTQQGDIAGGNLAYADLSGQPLGSHHDMQANYQDALTHALADCHFDNYVGHGSWSIPSLTSPTQAFIDVVSQTSELNASEDRQIAAEQAFGHAYDSAYQQTVDAQAPGHSTIDASSPSVDAGGAGSHGGGFDQSPGVSSDTSGGDHGGGSFSGDGGL